MEATKTIGLLYNLVYLVMLLMLGVAILVGLTWKVLSVLQHRWLPSFEAKLYNVVPIKQEEIPKFLRYTSLLFLILFCYTVGRDIKDSLVINAEGSGAPVLNFLKLFLVLPLAIIFGSFYGKVVDMINKYRAFYFFTIFFMVYFIIHGFILMPYSEYLHPHALMHSIMDNYSDTYLIGGIIRLAAPAFGNWVYSIFYAFAEIWGSMMLSLLFWWYVNNNTTSEVSKRFYPIMAIMAQLSLSAAGLVVNFFSQTLYKNDTIASTKGLMAVIALAAFIIIVIYSYSLKYDVPSMDDEKAKVVKKKEKPSMTEGFKYLLKHEYLLYTAIIVMSYGIAINLTETTWKAVAKLNFPVTTDYMSFMGLYSSTMGLVTIVFMIIGSRLIRNFSWAFCAFVTPVFAGFFGIIYFAIANYALIGGAGLTAGVLVLILLAGFIQNVLSKSPKYALFDSTKEMTYLPLDHVGKTKGKAAVDVVGARLGKSAGALTQMILFAVFNARTQIDILPYVSIIFVGVMALWMWSVYRLKNTYAKKHDTNYQKS